MRKVEGAQGAFWRKGKGTDILCAPAWREVGGGGFFPEGGGAARVYGEKAARALIGESIKGILIAESAHDGVWAFYPPGLEGTGKRSAGENRVGRRRCTSGEGRGRSLR